MAATAQAGGAAPLATNVPTFINNLVIISRRALTLKALTENSDAIRKNLVDNINIVSQNLLRWSDFVAKNISTEHFADVAERFASDTAAFQASLAAFLAALEGASARADYYDVFLDQQRLYVEACVLLHQRGCETYLRRVELACARAAEHISQLGSTDDRVTLIACYNAATNTIAHLAEVCSLLSIQSTTPAVTSTTMHGHFCRLNELNEATANAINNYLQAKSDGRQQALVELREVLRVLEGYWQSILTDVETERSWLMSDTLVSSYQTAVEVELSRARDMVRESQLDDLVHRGPVKRLARFAKKSGTEVSKELQGMANDSEDVGKAMVGLMHAMSDSTSGKEVTSSLLRETSRKAAPRVRSLSINTANVLRQQVDQQTRVLSSDEATREFAAISVDLRALSTQLDAMCARAPTNDEARAFPALRENLQQVLTRAAKRVASAGEIIGDAQCATLQAFLRAQLTTLSTLSGAEATRQIVWMANKVAGDAFQELQQFISNIGAIVDTNGQLMTEVHKEIEAQGDHLSGMLESATLSTDGGELSEEGRSTLMKAVVDVESLMELSNSIIPDVLPQPEDLEAAGMKETVSTMLPAYGAPADVVELPPLETLSLSATIAPTKAEITPTSPVRSGSSGALLSSSQELHREETAEERRKRISEMIKGDGIVKTVVKTIETLATEEQIAARAPALIRATSRGNIAQLATDDMPSSDIPTRRLPSSASTEMLAHGAASPGKLIRSQTERSLVAQLAFPMRHHNELADANIWNESSDMQYDVLDNGKKVVKGATVNQIIIYLTSPASDADEAQTGSEFYMTALMTLQTFTSPETFFHKLKERFEVPACPPDIEEATYDLEVRRPLQMRVCNLLKKWIVSRFDQDLEGRPELIAQVQAFISGRMAREAPQLSKNIEQCLATYVSGERAVMYTQRPLIVDDPNRPVKEGEKVFSALSLFDAHQVAVQLTIIEARLFRRIRLSELVGQAWNKSDAETRCPNLIKLVGHTNRVTVWVASSVIAQSTVRNRKKVVSHFVHLCQHFRQLRNFNGVMAVLAGLSTAAVARLKYTWSEVSPKLTKMLRDLEDEMSSAGSFRVYREALRKASAPVLPFIGLILSDLTFIEDGNPDTTPDGLIHWQKRVLLFTVLSQLLELQRKCRYDQEPTALTRSLLLSIAQNQTPASQLFRFSLQLEPRDGVPADYVERPTLLSTLKRLREFARR